MICSLKTTVFEVHLLNMVYPFILPMAHLYLARWLHVRFPLLLGRCCVDHCFTRICCPGSMLHILIEITISSRMAHSRMPPFPLGKNCSFAVIFAVFKVSVLCYLGVLKLKGHATAHQKMGSLKQTIWQLQAAKVKQC